MRRRDEKQWVESVIRQLPPTAVFPTNFPSKKSVTALTEAGYRHRTISGADGHIFERPHPTHDRPYIKIELQPFSLDSRRVDYSGGYVRQIGPWLADELQLWCPQDRLADQYYSFPSLRFSANDPDQVSAVLEQRSFENLRTDPIFGGHALVNEQWKWCVVEASIDELRRSAHPSALLQSSTGRTIFARPMTGFWVVDRWHFDGIQPHLEALGLNVFDNTNELEGLDTHQAWSLRVAEAWFLAQHPQSSKSVSISPYDKDEAYRRGYYLTPPSELSRERQEAHARLDALLANAPT